jgi:hypothetical protein
MKNLVRFTALLLSIITTSALMAHLLALPGKIHLPAADYLTVQHIYSGWAFLGICEFGAIILSIIWTIQEQRHMRWFGWLFTATSLLVVSMAIFFLYTFPANQATANWTKLPGHWEALRKQWEYSHAVRAGLNLLSVSLLLWMLLRRRH